MKFKATTDAKDLDAVTPGRIYNGQMMPVLEHDTDGSKDISAVSRTKFNVVIYNDANRWQGYPLFYFVPGE